MSEIWNTLIDCQNQIINILDQHCIEINEPGMEKFNKPDTGWINRVWVNDSVRRAHIDVVDARETKKLWMMHVCVFPSLNNDSPIYGFDVIAGKNKITGAFLDYSPTLDDQHPLLVEYIKNSQSFVPNKQRNLPNWAKNIFSHGMVAAGNVNTVEESKKIVDLAVSNLKFYLCNINQYQNNKKVNEIKKAQNYYCENQQMNPHTPRTMKSLGLNDQEVDTFCKDMLFPKIDR